MTLTATNDKRVAAKIGMATGVTAVAWEVAELRQRVARLEEIVFCRRQHITHGMEPKDRRRVKK